MEIVKKNNRKSDHWCNAMPTWAALPGARILTDAHPTNQIWLVETLECEAASCKAILTVDQEMSWCKRENYFWAKIFQNRQDLCGFPANLDELPSDPKKMSEGFCEARLLGKICGGIFGCLKVGALGHSFGGDHEIDCFSAL